ncbi:MAG TPA: TfoX/Sxy family protein [Gemmatimonadales bacterium]|nr:TfoX/Sxy family protein [Gemmatimonadales bacterium]
MPVSDSYREFVLDQLGRALPVVRARRMFGGVGVYAGDRFFALIDDDVLYFKVDDGNRGAYEARSMGPFMPFGPGGEVMQYYEVPADVLEDSDLLREWAEGAVGAAERARKGKRARPPRKRRPGRQR